MIFLEYIFLTQFKVKTYDNILLANCIQFTLTETQQNPFAFSLIPLLKHKVFTSDFYTIKIWGSRREFGAAG